MIGFPFDRIAATLARGIVAGRANTVALFSTAANASADVFTADELLYAIVGTAALPASGTMVVDFYVSVMS